MDEFFFVIYTDSKVYTLVGIYPTESQALKRCDPILHNGLNWEVGKLTSCILDNITHVWGANNFYVELYILRVPADGLDCNITLCCEVL